jgi:cytidylate kinase
LIYFVSGPPGSGKTTLCRALMDTYSKGLHLPVDDLRLWVTSGLADSVPWTEETERQFQIAEKAACAVARTYSQAGFMVAVDHCRNPQRLDEVIAENLSDLSVRKVLLLPDLETNLQRNLDRTNKEFDPAVLQDVIRFTNERYRLELSPNWLVIDNTDLTVEETLNRIRSD